MATQVFADEELERLRGFPEIGRDELFRFFTLTSADVAFVDPGRGRGPADRLGLAVALCTLPWLGFVPDEVRAAPPVAVARLAERLRVDPEVLAGYGERPQTRTDHLRLVTDYLSWKPAASDSVAFKELEEFLQGRAMEHDSPTTLFNLACEYLIAARTVRPGVVTLTQMVASARTAATALTYQKVAHLLTGQVMEDLDLLLRFDAGLGMTRLAWLTAPAVGGDGDIGNGRDRQVTVPAGDGRPCAGPVDAGGRAAPVSGHGRAAEHQSGPGTAGGRTALSDPADPGGAVRGRPAR